MHELTSKELVELEWGDAQFYGFHWVEGSKEPTLVIHIQPCNSSVMELVCPWATELSVQLNYNIKNQVGPLLTLEVKFEQKGGELWEIYIDLAGHGYVSFIGRKMFVRTFSDNENA